MIDPKARASVTSWIDPDDVPPPRATKLNLLTIGGVAIYGQWDDSFCVAWAPLLTVSPKIRAKLLKRYPGDPDHVSKP